jgi:hypothetical protein
MFENRITIELEPWLTLAFIKFMKQNYEAVVEDIGHGFSYDGIPEVYVTFEFFSFNKPEYRTVVRFPRDDTQARGFRDLLERHYVKEKHYLDGEYRDIYKLI